jgi:hypothetical protein
MQPAAGTGKPLRSLEIFGMFMKPAERRGRFGRTEEIYERSKKAKENLIPNRRFPRANFECSQERQTLPPIALGLSRFPGKLHSRMGSERALLR